MNKILVFSLSALLLFGCESDNDAEFLPWDYPVKPGMEEWAQFKSNEEMVMACQIPEKVLSSLSTEDLTDLCLRYPLLGDIHAFNFLDMGLNKLFSDFNGIRELYKREEISNYLIKRYRGKMDTLSSFTNADTLGLEMAFLQISIANMDALFSRIEKQNGSLKEVLQALVDGYEVTSNLDINKRFFLEYNYFSRAHVIIKICDKCIEEIPQGSNNAVFSPHGADVETADIINKLSYQLIK